MTEDGQFIKLIRIQNGVRITRCFPLTPRDYQNLLELYGGFHFDP